MTKCKFQFAFLEGEMEVDDNENELMIVNIDNMREGKDGIKKVYFIMNEGILFRLQKETEDEAVTICRRRCRN